MSLTDTVGVSKKISNVDFMTVPPKKTGHQTSFVIPQKVLKKPEEKWPIHIIHELLVGSSRMLVNAKIQDEYYKIHWCQRRGKTGN